MESKRVYRMVLCVGAASLCGFPLGVEAQSATVTTYANQAPAIRHVSVSVKGASVLSVIESIIRQAGLNAAYDASLFAGAAPVTMIAEQIPADRALQQALRNTDLVAQIDGYGYVTVTRAVTANVQGEIVVGKVIHARTKQPVAGARVFSTDVHKVAVTGDDGTFRLLVGSGEQTLQVRAVGFTRFTKAITVQDGETVTVDVSLEPSASVLDEVVVTGTVAATERRAITTPITVITGEEIAKRGITRIEDLLHGEVPGVFAMDLGVAAYRPSLGQSVSATVYSRGSSSLDGGPTPMKTFIDGVELLDPAYLGTIDPQSIDRIEIITGPQAATVYGSGALGGVMQIFTKKGAGTRSQEYVINLRYGMLQSNMSTGRTPVHTHSMSTTGGTGPSFSYSANVSYNYTGQWQPRIFNGRTGAQLGVRFASGPVEFNASASFTYGRSGTTQSGGWAIGPGSAYETAKLQSGEWWSSQGNQFVTSSLNNRKSTSRAKTLAFTARYRVNAIWLNDLTIGQSENTLSLDPASPQLRTSADTLFQYQGSSGGRLSGNYSAMIHPAPLGFVAPTLVIGVNGSVSGSNSFSGALVSPVGAQLQSPSVTLAPRIQTWGGFADIRIGLFRQVYANLGVRGDKHSFYGGDVKVKWTPTNGLAWTFDYNDISVKLLGSYGKATRPPTADMKLGVKGSPAPGLPQGDLVPNLIYTTLAAPELTAEVEAGPQGGVEIYWGNRGFITFNRFQQRVTDLIQLRPAADSIWIEIPSGIAPDHWRYQFQYQNIGSIDKKGWDATMSVNLWAFSMRGVFSWNDSRIRYALPGSGYQSGQQLRRDHVPSHSGSISVSYASGGTSFLLTSDITGASTLSYHPELSGMMRLRVYASSVKLTDTYDFRSAGYTKAKLMASQRLSRRATMSLNIINLGNSFASDMVFIFPSLGRQTQLGVSLRF